jgi:PKD repeat protein
LQRSSGAGQFVDLVVSPNPTVLAIAHRDSTYIVEEVKTIPNAWGPINTSATRHLYWDVNLLTGVITRGMTLFQPIYSSSEPTSPALDQHWFDTDKNTFFVWTAEAGWVERVRIFAGYVTSGAIIRPAAIGSQAGLIGNFEGGHLIRDSFGMPLRQANGCFVTSASQLNVTNLGTVTTRIEGTISSVYAAEEIPRFHLISLQAGGRAVLARSTDYRMRIGGLVAEDLYEGDVAKLFTSGVVRSPFFSWPADKINRPLFCGPTGQITLTPPSQGVLQQVGFVYDVDAVLMAIHQVIVLDDPADIITVPPPAPFEAPIANFFATPTSGLAPLEVVFTSTASGAITTEWDFLNDGFIDATGPAAVHTFQTPGTFTVRQRVINGFGQDDEVKTGYITVTSPATLPTKTNLGLSFGAPAQLTAGRTFTLQVITSNDGLLNATDVLRQIVLKANNSTQLTITAPPVGTTISYTNGKTVITLPLIPLASGASATVALQVAVQSNVNKVMIDGNVSSPEIDSEGRDNSASLTIEART